MYKLARGTVARQSKKIEYRVNRKEISNVQIHMCGIDKNREETCEPG